MEELRHMKAANTNLVKEINLNLVRQVMKRVEMASKPQLAALTKLSVVTINSLVKELHELGELVEDETVPSSGGRPALTYRFNYNFRLALVIHLKEPHKGLEVSAAVINLENQVLAKEESTTTVFNKEQLYTMIGDLLTRYPSIKVIGIGIPGQIVDGEITVASHPEMTGIRLIDELQAQFNLPVLVENDINAAISGYCSKQELTDEECIVGLYFPLQYPPGMGIYLDEKILKGKKGMAGEIKFLPLQINWYQELDPDTFIEAVCQIIQTVNAILAPDKIVIYQNLVNPATWDTAWLSFLSRQLMPSFPEVILQDTFQQDFESGMRWLTLRQLEPPFLLEQY